MKKFAAICLLIAALALACLFLFSHRSHTGLVLVQNRETAGHAWTSTTWIAGDSARFDEMGDTSTIFDLVTGDATIISRPSRTFTKLSLPQMVARTRAFMLADPATPSAPPQIADTGRTEMVNGFNSRVYTAETPSIKFTCWITRDFPAYAEVNAQLKKYRSMERMGALFPDLSEIDGMLVKSEIAPASGPAITVTFVSAKIQPIRDSLFRVPADYILLPTSSLPAAAPQAPAVSQTPAP